MRFEPNVNGTFVRVMFASFDPDAPGTAPTITDLNPHLDYTGPQVAQTLRDQSIGDPRGIAWRGGWHQRPTSPGWVRTIWSWSIRTAPALGSQRRSRSVKVATGIVADDSRGQLYILNRFEATISVVNMVSETEVAKVAFFDPTPEADQGRPPTPLRHPPHFRPRPGRPARRAMSDSRTDRLAWDLGDPGGEMVGGRHPPAQPRRNIPGLTTNFTDFHPMKGPMTTQTLQDIIGKEPHHWRGDRDGIEAFNGAFRSLLGDDVELTNSEMQEFEDYLATITIPPNPFRGLDNSLPTDLPLPGQVTGDRFGSAGQAMPNGNALRAFTNIYRPLARGIDRGAFACITCHTVPLGMGADTTASLTGFMPIDPGPRGEHHHALVSVDGSSQRNIKIPQLRTLYDKLGFDMTSARSRSGFGILHDGSVDGLSRFLSEGAFEPANNQEVADLVALMMAFSGSDFPGTPETFEPPGTPSLDAHAAVGKQVTRSAANSSSTLDALIALADAGEVDLVVHSTPAGTRAAGVTWAAINSPPMRLASALRKPNC